ncbi:MAG: ABC transporter substrate binding protein [Pseudolabrys sp.]|jgi:hypothetical protein
MNYRDTRDSEQLRILDKSIDTFISGFHPTAQTIIFFPGGLASRLLRAKTPYKPNISAPQRFDFDGQEVWLSAWTFGHPELNALKLRMHKEADGFYHDEDDRKPAIYPYRYFAADGGLITYGPDQIDQWRGAAIYIDRILKGEKPAALPVQTPTKYEFAINLKAAKALGLAVPPTLIARADEVVD